jgi:hypothetical protein
MSGNINNGGFAFPNQWNFATKGMTLRDYFAAQALSGLVLDPQLGQEISTVASSAYRIADAMIAAREVRS